MKNEFDKSLQNRALKMLEDRAIVLDKLHQSSSFKLLKNSPNAFDRLPKTAAERMYENVKRKVSELDSMPSGGVLRVVGASKNYLDMLEFSGRQIDKPMPFNANLNMPAPYVSPRNKTNEDVNDLKKRVKVLEQVVPRPLTRPLNRRISPKTPYSNRKHIKDIVSSLEDEAYWVDKHFHKKAFDILLEGLDTDKISSFTIISLDENMTQSAVSDFLLLKKELSFKGVTLEWGIIHDEATKRSFHDRWIFDMLKVWNVPPVRSIIKDQEADIIIVDVRPDIDHFLANCYFVK